jgi:hypothetical protein
MKFQNLPINIQNQILFELSAKLENDACQAEADRLNLDFDIWKSKLVENWLIENQNKSLSITDWLILTKETDLSIIITQKLNFQKGKK